MNKRDKETLKLLQNSFFENAGSIEVPESLGRDALKSQINTIDLSREAIKPKVSTGALARFAVAAASLAIIIAVTLVFKSGMFSGSVGISNAFDGFKLSNLIKPITSDEELDEAISNIVNSGDTVAPAKPSETKPGTVTDGATDSTVNESENAPSVPPITQSITDKQSGPVGTANIVTHSGNLICILSSAKTEKGPAYQLIRILKTDSAGGIAQAGVIDLSPSGASDIYEDCFEIRVKDSVLIALISRSNYNLSGSGMAEYKSVVTRYYDISDPAKPTLIREQSQDGSFAYSSLDGSSFILVTAKELGSGSAVPTLSVGGENVPIDTAENDVSVIENIKEKAYLFLTVTDVSDFSKTVEKLEVLGCGPGADICSGGGEIYISRAFSSTETGDSLTEIYAFSSSGGKLASIGSISLPGKPVCAPVCDGGLMVITSDGGKLCAYKLSPSLEITAEYDGIDAPVPDRTLFAGKIAFAVYKDELLRIDFSGRDITVFRDNSASGIDAVYALPDGSAAGICSPDKDGKITLTGFNAKGEKVSDYNLGSTVSSPAVSDSGAVAVSETGGTVGIPAIIRDGGSDRSVYMLFTVKEGKIEPVGIYTHEENFSGDAATRALIDGDNLYTVSGGKTVSFSVSGRKIQDTADYR